MNEKLKSYLEKGKSAAGKISKKVWIIAGVVLVVLAAAITIYLNTRPWVTLIVSSDQNELSAVLSWLSEQGYSDYRLEGDTILVPSTRAGNLKAGLLAAGYPKTGYLHNPYFDNINMMSTESERIKVGQIDLEGELSYVLSSIPGIESASVTITPGENNAYILDPSNVVNAKASVYVVTRNDELLNSDTVLTIRNFVAHAVQGLTMDEVVVMDQYLIDYTGMLGNSSSGDMINMSAFKIQIQTEYENKVRRAILQLLQKMFGAENVEVAVNCDVDVNSKEVTDYEVHQPEGAVWTESGLGGIIGERRYSYAVITENGAAPGGTVGTTTNSDLPDDNFPSYVEQDPDMTGDPDRLTGDGELIYDNSKTQTHYYINSAEITDCHVSVAINSTTAGPVDVESLRELIANAAGINAIVTEEMTAAEYLSSKVTVVTHPFYDSTEQGGQNPSHGGWDSVIFGGIPMWVLIAAAAGLVLFIIILLVIMLLRGKRRKKKIAAQAAQEALEAKEIADIIAIVEPVGEEPKGADVMELQTERSMELRQDIRQFAEENPEVAAQLLKAWLRGGEDDG